MGKEPSSKYQVFLSFRGPDTRQGFTDTLFEYLTDAGIRVFRDNNELRVGRSIGDALMQAIEESQIYIPIFSKTYAESKWCLRELAKMVEATRKSKQVKEIIPIFCGVTVDDVKREDGLYDVAMTAHSHGEGSKQIVQWKEALRRACEIKGWELKDEGHAKFCKPIVREISIKLGVKNQRVADCLVVLGDQVKAPPNGVNKRVYLAILYALWIMALSIVVFLLYHSVNEGKQDAEMGSWCDLRARVLQDRFIFHLNHLHFIGNLIRRFYYSNNPLDGKKMQELLASYINTTAHLHPFFKEVHYAERVVREERLNFERRHGWEIMAFQDYHDYYPRIAPVQDEYAPVIFCAGDRHPQVISLDMMSIEEKRENVLKTRDTGSISLSSPLKLRKNVNDRVSTGLLLTYPVYQTDLPHNTPSEDRIKATLGYTGVVFDFEAFATNVLIELNDTDIKRKRMAIYDGSTADPSRLIYGGYNEEDDYSDSFIHPLELGDSAREHIMVCRLVEERDYSWVEELLLYNLSVMVGFILIRIVFSLTKSERRLLNKLIFGKVELIHRSQAVDDDHQIDLPYQD